MKKKHFRSKQLKDKKQSLSTNKENTKQDVKSEVHTRMGGFFPLFPQVVHMPTIILQRSQITTENIPSKSNYRKQK